MRVSHLVLCWSELCSQSRQFLYPICLTIVSFFEYKLRFRAVFFFCIKQLQCFVETLFPCFWQFNVWLWLKLNIFHGLNPVRRGQIWPFSKCSHFPILIVFWSGLLHTTTLICSRTIVFRTFLAFLIFDPNWPFSKGSEQTIYFGNWLFPTILGILNIYNKTISLKINTHELIATYLLSSKKFLNKYLGLNIWG